MIAGEGSVGQRDYWWWNYQEKRMKQRVVDPWFSNTIELNVPTHQGSHFGDYLTGANNCNFAFHLIDNTTTLRIIKNMKSSTSKGHDGISSELLKLITSDVSKCITTIINQS